MAGGGEYKIAIKIAGQLEKSFGSALNGVKSGLGTLKSFGKVGAAAMTAAGTAITAVAAGSINVGKDFEAAMSSTAATASATGEDYDKLKKAAMEMGRSTSKTATESANALEYMALAGWSVDQSIQGLPSVLRLSEATGSDLARTSDLVTDSMSACGVTVDELSSYLDVCAKANNKSNQTAEQLMEAYIGVGGTMKGLGVPIEDSATALGVMANRGIKGSEAGNALNAIMTNLTTGTGQAGKMMDKLGISAFDSEGNFRGLQETLQLVNEKTQGMTEEQRNAALAAIGGKQHIDALNDLMSGLNTTTEEGVTEWEALAKELNNSSGALETMAKTKLDNLNGDIATFQSALQDTGIKIYDNMSAPLREMTQFGTEMIYQLSDALAAGGFDGFVAEIGNVLSEVVLKIAEYAPQVINMATSMVMSFADGIRKNSGQIAAGAVEIGTAILTGLIQIVPEIIVTGAELISQFAAGAAQQLPELVTLGIQGLQQIVTGILTNLPTVISSAASIINTLMQGLTQAIPILIQGGMQAIGMLIQGLVASAPMLMQTAVQLIAQLLIGLANMLPSLMAMGIQLIMGLAQGLIANLPLIIQAGTQLILSLINGIVQMIPMIIQSGIQLIISLLQGIIANLGNIVEAAVAIVVALAQGLITGIPQLINAIPQMIEAIVNTILTTNWLEVGWEIIKGIGSGILKGAASIGGAVVDGIKGLLGFGDDGESEEASTKGAEVSNAYANGLQAGGTTAQTTAGTTAQAALNAFGTGTDATNAYGMEAATAFTNGLQAGGAEAQTAASAVGTQSMDAFNTSLGASQAFISANTMQIGTGAANGLNAGLQNGLSGAASGVETSMQQINAAGSNSLNALNTNVTTSTTNTTKKIVSLWQSAKASLSSTWASLSGAFSSSWASVHSTAVGKARETVAAIKSAFEGMTITIPRPKLPQVNVSYTEKGEGDAKVKLPTFTVSYFAAGGILKNPTQFGWNGGPMVGGEAGPEAILPLSELWSKMRSILNDILQNRSRGSTIFQDILAAFKTGGGRSPEPAMAGGPSQITYAPVYHFNSGTPTRDDIKAADRLSREEFAKMMKEWEKDNGRTKF